MPLKLSSEKIGNPSDIVHGIVLAGLTKVHSDDSDNIFCVDVRIAWLCEAGYGDEAITD